MKLEFGCVIESGLELSRCIWKISTYEQKFMVHRIILSCVRFRSIIKFHGIFIGA